MLAGMLGDKAEIADVYRRNRPDCTPAQLLTAVFGDFVFRRKAIHMAERRARSASAPTYMYVLAFETDVFEGRYGTPHILDLPLAFAHPEHPILGANLSRFTVSRQMTASWAAFARSGDPSNALLPTWPPYDEATRSAMYFDVPARVEGDPRPDERTAW
ncbi:carboxylesterase family protein [uncultured Sphingomonas sp.]|uniref:carboxylesterase family protein n=1 Tax=uncultured Sphingomonas sp. TaxID=158754 RepID=UPI0035CC1E77